MASAVTPFGQWLALTREKPVGDINKLLNDAVKNTYFFGRLIKGAGEKILETGTQITEKIKLENINVGGEYRPGEPANLQRVTTARTISIPPRFYRSHVHWTDAEVMLQGSDRSTAFVKFKKSCEQDLETDCWEMVENALWAQPDCATMEQVSNDDAGKAYSVPVFITQNTSTGAYMPPGWSATASTLETLSPTTYSGWRNYQKGYSSGSPYGSGGLFQAFDDIMLSIKFEPPASAKDYFERDELQRMFIVTNKAGRTLYQEGLRQGNDHFRGTSNAQDPSYGSPVFNGFPILYAAALDTALLEESAGAYTGAVWTNPRFYFINGNFLHPKLMNKGGSGPFEDVGPVMVSGLQADTDIWYRKIWWNLVCRSRKRQAIAYPT